jgi:hypothetical protein
MLVLALNSTLSSRTKDIQAVFLVQDKRLDTTGFLKLICVNFGWPDHADSGVLAIPVARFARGLYQGGTHRWYT